MARKKIEDMIEELRSWLPNYDSRSANDYPVLVFRILASLPGGDDLEDMGYETFNIGWHEADQLARMIDAIQDKQDVEDLVRGLVYDEEEDEVDEARAGSSANRIELIAAEIADVIASARNAGYRGSVADYELTEYDEDSIITAIGFTPTREEWHRARRRVDNGEVSIPARSRATEPRRRPTPRKKAAPRKKSRRKR